jgi:hypothetical protein
MVFKDDDFEAVWGEKLLKEIRKSIKLKKPAKNKNDDNIQILFS